MNLPPSLSFLSSGEFEEGTGGAEEEEEEEMHLSPFSKGNTDI